MLDSNPASGARVDEGSEVDLVVGVEPDTLLVPNVVGLDEDRARDWVIVRMVVNASWTVAEARAAGRALATDEQNWITRCLAIVKAVQE